MGVLLLINENYGSIPKYVTSSTCMEISTNRTEYDTLSYWFERIGHEYTETNVPTGLVAF